MSEEVRIALVIVVSTVVLMALIGVSVLLMVVNSKRRHQHQAELVQLRLKLAQEMAAAQLESAQQTMNTVGRELHDHIGQYFSGVRMLVDQARERMPESPHLMNALLMIDEEVSELRRVSHSLNTELWAKRSFCDAVQQDAARMKSMFGMVIEVEETGSNPIPPDRTMMLYRVFQETMNNARKHGKALKMHVRVERTGPLRITIHDNGSGFDPATVTENAGLTNIRKRCALIGFDATCTSAPREGCTWVLQERS